MFNYPEIHLALSLGSSKSSFISIVVIKSLNKEKKNYNKDATIVNLQSQNKINTSTANSNNNIKNVITTTNNNNNKNATTANLLEMIWKSMGQGILLLWLARHTVTSSGSEKEEKYKKKHFIFFKAADNRRSITFSFVLNAVMLHLKLLESTYCDFLLTTMPLSEWLLAGSCQNLCSTPSRKVDDGLARSGGPPLHYYSHCAQFPS